MSAVLVVAVVIGIFFLIGLFVGVVVMIALSRRRMHSAERQTRVARTPPSSRPDDDEPDEPGWWQSRIDY